MSLAQGHTGTGIQTYVISFQGPGSRMLPSGASWSTLRIIRVATLGCFKGSRGCELGFESGKELGGTDRRKDWRRRVCCHSRKHKVNGKGRDWV